MKSKFYFSEWGFSILVLFLIPVGLKAQWQQLSLFPAQGSAYGVGFSDGQSGYVGLGQYPPAGQTFSDFYRFNPEADQWTQIASLPVGLTRAVAAGVNGKGYCGTGSMGNTKVNLWYEYDPVSDTWSARATFPGLARDNAFCFVLNNKIYVGGGTSRQPLFDDMYAYDPATNTWSPAGSLPGPRIFPATFFVNGKAYLFGGFEGSGPVC